MGRSTRLTGVALGLGGLVALFLPLGANDYLLHVTIISIYYAILASS